jgi:hypothetical protein
MPIEAQVNPFPKELTTPPVTKMCLAILALSTQKNRKTRGLPDMSPWVDLYD